MLEWCLLYLLRYPDCQTKLQQEIAALTENDARRVRLEDRHCANYANAFIDEVARHCPLAALPPAHKTMADVTFRGKLYPKGTQVKCKHVQSYLLK